MQTFTKLCTYFYLKKELDECKAYDGWTEEDQTEYYIKQNGFNPFNALKAVKTKLLREYKNILSDEAYRYIISTDKDYNFETELKQIQDDINTSLYENKKLVKKFLFDVYFNNKAN